MTTRDALLSGWLGASRFVAIGFGIKVAIVALRPPNLFGPPLVMAAIDGAVAGWVYVKVTVLAGESGYFAYLAGQSVAWAWQSATGRAQGDNGAAFVWAVLGMALSAIGAVVAAVGPLLFVHFCTLSSGPPLAALPFDAPFLHRDAIVILAVLWLPAGFMLCLSGASGEMLRGGLRDLLL